MKNTPVEIAVCKGNIRVLSTGPMADWLQKDLDESSDEVSHIKELCKDPKFCGVMKVRLNMLPMRKWVFIPKGQV